MPSRLVRNISPPIKKIPLHHQPRLLRLPSLILIRKQPHSFRAPKAPLPLDLEELVPLRVFGVVCRWDREVLFADLEHGIAGHVGDGFAAGEREGVAFDGEDGLVGGVGGDGEGVTAQGHHFFFEDDGFALAGGVVGEDGDGLGERGELGGHG